MSNPNEATALYDEEQLTQRWVMVVAWLGAGFTGLAILATFFISIIPSFVRLVAAAIFLAAFFSVWNFRRLHIRATAEGITFGFGIFRWHLRWMEIVHADVRPYIFLRFLGWGIRLDLRGTIGFIARSSMGVQLETPRLKYFISTDHPEKICELANRFILAQQKKN